MVDFIKVKINRISDSVSLQHLWNSIDDIILSDLPATKINVIERCQIGYGLEPTDINKNLFLALKEGTITRNVKTDILSRNCSREDRSQGDWYCFLCHKCGPDTRCRKCDTSFHSNCNSDLFDQFHCHTCRQSGQFSTDFHKFSTITQSQVIRRIIHSNKLKWKSLNVVGYIKDEQRNKFFIYKTMNSAEIDKNFCSGEYFSTNKNCKNFLFDLLMLKHNCAVIYGIEHAFCKLITGYIKHLHLELENIYCDSCYILFTKHSIQKLSSMQKQDLFSSVCSVKHQIMWGLVPPNIFWPFKVISHDNDRFYGIKFSPTIHFNRHKIESFTKETCLVWSSYNPQMCDRPSLDLLKAYSLAQKYAQNLSEKQKCSNLPFITHNKKRKKTITNIDSDSEAIINQFSKSKKKVLQNKTHKKVGRPPLRRKVGRPPLKKNVVEQCNEKKVFIENLSSTDSSISIYNCSLKEKKPRKPKKIADVFVSSDTERSERKTSTSKRQSHIQKIKRTSHNYSFLSSTDSESDSKYEHDKISESETRFRGNTAVRLDYTNHQPIQLPSSVDSSQTSQLYSNYRRYAQNYENTSSENEFEEHEESFSSDATVPQRLDAIERNHHYKDFNRSHCHSESGSDVKHFNRINNNSKTTNQHRSQCDLPTSSKYSAYSPSSSRSSHYMINDFSNNKESLKSIFKETNQGLVQIYKDGINNPVRNNNLETGLYCSSSSPVNFSPMSTNQHANVAQFSMQSTPSSNYPMSCDEIPHAVNHINGNVNSNWKNRTIPLKLGITINNKIGKTSRIGTKKNKTSNHTANNSNQNGLLSDSTSDNDY